MREWALRDGYHIGYVNNLENGIYKDEVIFNAHSEQCLKREWGQDGKTHYSILSHILDMFYKNFYNYDYGEEEKKKHMKAKFKDINGNIHELEVPEKKMDMNIEILGIGVTPHSYIYIFYTLNDETFHLDLKHSLKFDGHLFSNQDVDTCDLLTNELETIKEELQDPKWKIILDKLARKTLLD